MHLPSLEVSSQYSIMEITKERDAQRSLGLTGGIIQRVGEEEVFPAIKTEIADEDISNEKNHVFKMEVVDQLGSEYENLASRKQKKKTASKRKNITNRVTKAKRSQINWMIKDKIKALDHLQDSKTKAQVSKLMEIPESTLRGWKKDEKNIREKYNCLKIVAAELISQYLKEKMLRVINSGSLLPPPPSTIKTNEELSEWLEEQRPELENTIQAVYLYELHRSEEIFRHFLLSADLSKILAS